MAASMRELLERVNCLEEIREEIQTKINVMETDLAELYQEIENQPERPDTFKIRITPIDGCEIMGCDYDGEDVDIMLRPEE